MKFKRTIGVNLTRHETLKIPDNEVWIGFLNNRFVLEYPANQKISLYGYNYSLNMGGNSVDTGRAIKFIGTPGCVIKCTDQTSANNPLHTFTCLVFSI